MNKYFLLFYFFRVCLLDSVYDDRNTYVKIKEVDVTNINRQNKIATLNATLYHTVKRYYCSAASAHNQELLLYGSKAWTFPPQDVNLTLKYPTKNSKENEYTDYIVTELRVMLYIHGSDSKGYITGGGLLQNNISLTFIMGNISRLYYQFWLYGVSRSFSTATENYATAYQELC